MAKLYTRESGERVAKGEIDGATREGIYEVGYGKPPKAHRFKKGQSGNPAGKRKRKAPVPKPASAELGGLIAEELLKPQKVIIDGKQVEKPRIELLAQRLTMLILKSDSLPQIKSAMDMLQRLGVPVQMLEKIESLDNEDTGPWTPELEAKFLELEREFSEDEEMGDF
ncbi:DUF5681 domain-containing protein [Aurantiacibacter gangjinensis]|uniref:DUF5681 domain-containing protein n=1 Tax=Aurantiacibacter gangjinensis TaxID=502682 RepID=A0A0G9MMS4_9SPHN|nr:DUF5681 domain-containing protein [Aurantiacibacter gangjinensis]KLE31995.1 hypothetical protein AAW01_11230 [Aurantiacibacter gangjinensis]